MFLLISELKKKMIFGIICWVMYVEYANKTKINMFALDSTTFRIRLFRLLK